VTQLSQVLDELMAGPATSQDIADATGLQRKHAAHYLSELVGMGLATRSLNIIREPGKRGRGCFIYTPKVAT